MSRTEVTSGQIKDGEVKRSDLNIATSGSAVITRLLAGSGISIDSSTGADSGTGDVTISAPGGATVVSQTTTNATPTLLTSLTPAGSSVTWFKLFLAARLDDTGTNKSYWAEVVGAVRRNNNGTAVLVGQTLIFDDHENASGYAVTVSVSGNDLQIFVTGAASETVHWNGSLSYQSAV